MKILFIFLFLFSTSISSYAVQNGVPGPSEVSDSILTPCKQEYRNAFNSDSSNFTIPEDIGDYQTSLSETYAKRSSDLAHCLVTKTDEIFNSRFIKNSDLSISISAIDHGYSSSVEFETVAPLWQNADESQVLFLQPGFVLSIKSNSRSTFDLNTGVVYRFTFDRGIIGFNIFHDVSYVIDDGEGNSLTHRRGSVGADYQSGRNYISFNYYFPITDWVNVNEYYKEHALGGFDVHFKRILTKRLSVKASLSYWDYQREQDRINPSLGLEYKTGCNSYIGADATFDPVREDFSVRLKFGLKLGVEDLDPETCLQESFNNNASVWTPVERENRVLYERVRRAPHLTIPDQITQKDEVYSYTISNTNFRHVQGGETPRVSVISRPDWLNYEPRSMRFSGIPDKVGIYQVSGTVSLPRDPEFSSWKFHIIVEETPSAPPPSHPPLLTTRDQSIEAGTALSYQVLDNDVGHVREGETPRIIIIDSSAANVSYDFQTKTFFTSPVNNVGIYIISGIISNEAGQESPWSFTLTVRDTNSPRLATRDQTIEAGTALSYQVLDNDISNLREGESIQITVNRNTANVSYDFQTRTFLTPILDSAGVYIITGTLSDEDGNTSPWSFTLTVEERVSPLPSLVTRDQTIEAGTALSYQVSSADISHLREGETATITVTRASAADVRYNSQTKTFLTEVLNTTGVYTIEGTISNRDGHSSPWSFTLTVEDTTAPSLFTRNHVIEVGKALSYQIQANDISGIRSGETPTIRIDTTAAHVSYDSQTRTFLTPVFNSTGYYIIGGVILDEDGNIGYWSFTLTVIEPIPPSLVIVDQFIEVETAFSYQIQDSDIHEINPGETATIEVTTASAANVRYNPQTKTFSTEVLNTTGTHRIEGIISDEDGHESRWSFALRVRDTKPPRLATRDQTIEVEGSSLFYKVEDEDITGLRAGETATIRITQPSAANVRYNRNVMFFSTSTLNNTGVHTIRGTISDEDGNSSPWSFTLTVKDTNSPKLATTDQTIDVGTALSYQIRDADISGLRGGERATITVTTASAANVSYNSQTKTFSTGVLDNIGVYKVEGIISDKYNNSSRWSFNLRVVSTAPPTLTTRDQTIDVGAALSYQVRDTDIRGLRGGERATITVTTASAANVSYNSQTKTFSTGVLNTEGTYNINGTIADSRGNSSTWSFTLTVETDETAPILTLANQRVEAGESWSYAITDNNISGLRDGETATIAVTSTLPTGVSYDSNSRTFSASSLNTVGEYTISGTISDGSHSNTWSFTLTVEDTTRPSLTLANQRVEAGESWSYAITDNNITGLRAGETATIVVTSSLPTGVSYDSNSRTFSASSLNTVGEYTISGTISDGSHSSTWSFTLTVEDTTRPSLTLANQTVEVGQSWSYQITDNNITGLRSGETAIIVVTSSLPTGVSYDSNSRTFSASSLNTVGESTISGTIADNSSNTNTWSFKLTVVADETAPRLALANQTVEAGESWSYAITDNNITGLRSGETATIVVTSTLPTGVSYSSRTFSASSLNTVGEYTISGTISDGSNSDTWSFTLTVEDTTRPSLTLVNQTVEVGESWSYQITDSNITGLRSGETATIAVTSSLPTGVSYDSNSRTFSASSLNTVGESTISGTIVDNSSNTNTWSFKLTVVADETAPRLALTNQTVEAGESWSYAITDNNITGLRSGETATIVVTSSLPTGVSYSSRIFSASSLDTTGEYTISGTISDGSNSDTWSFTLTVEDTTKPILTIANQTVEQRTAEWSYEIQDSNITGLRSGETVTILFTSSVPSGVSYNSSSKTFSASTSVLNTPDDYTISGTISDGSGNVNNWSFTLTVEADETAPSLALANQTVEAGESWSYQITDNNITGLRAGETATIVVTSTLPTGVSYSSRTFSASSLDTVGEYTISGTISDGSNSDTWSFTLTVEDTTRPSLTLANQTVEVGESWSYQITDNNINGLRSGETATIAVTSSLPTGVSYDSNSRTFSASSLNTVGESTISGTIADNSSNTNTWSFKLTVEADDTAPSLALVNQTVEAGESWFYAITDNNITGLRAGETATIVVTSTFPTGVSYSSRTFSASSLNTPGEYTISGTIADNSSNTNTWSFTLTVEDTTKPILTLANQTVEVGQPWSYAITDNNISDVRDGETATIAVTSSLPTGVSYSSRTFSASSLNTPGEYTISGTIADNSSNTNTWSFKLTVEADETAPSLALVNQTVEAGESWSYAITDEAISDLRDVETATIAITSTLPTGVSYSSRTFSASSLNTVGEYTISGTISDGSNSDTWSFTLTVEDTTKPILTIANQTVEQRTAEWSYVIQDSNISDSRSGEVLTITPSLPSGVSYNSSSRTFSASTSVLNTPGDYTISGTISDGSNSNTWEFTLTVEADDTAPSLALVNQTVEAGESWSYEITDEAISDLRDVETATIAITSTLPTGVSYSSRTFSASSLDTVGEYTISGTISDGSNSDTWSFTLTVEDTTKPILTIANQTVEQRTAEWSYQITDSNISDSRSGETVTILFTSSVPTGVSYNSSSKTFSASTSVLNTPGDYTISGTISDGSGNVNNWSFTLTVEADDTAPSLALVNQTVEAGESWSYEITDEAISDLRDVETATIAITSTLPTGVSYSSRTFSASSLDTTGEYTISGTISDGSNSDTWEFTLTVEDTTKPILTIANQTVEQRTAEWSYVIQDSNISDSRSGEVLTITPLLPSGVSYNSTTKTFSASTSVLNTPGDSTISGTISDGSGNVNNWSFTLTVEADDTAPSLALTNQTVEAGESWSYEITDEAISDLRDVETATIAITSTLPTGVSYDSATRTFSASSLDTVGEYTISGTISDGSNSDTWSFTLTVEDTTKPILTIANQTVEQRTAEWSYVIQDSNISDSRSGEVLTITPSLPSGVSYNSTTKTFSASTSVLNTPGDSTISGTISDGSGNVNTWSFTLTVEADDTAPSLALTNQTVEAGESWSYEITDEAISDLRDVETATIAITSTLPTGVSYSSRTFSASSLNTVGEYTISGTISDGSNSNTWEFTLTVEDTTKPSLTLVNQTVEVGQPWSYAITDNNISDVRAGETATIAVTSSLPTGVSYDSNSRTFSASSLNTPGDSTISGTIADNSSNTNTWSFKLTVVADETAPSLTLVDQTVEAGESWSYEIVDNNITGLRDGETATIVVTSSLPTGVSYDSATRTFSASSLDTTGESTISGTISDGSNSSTWSFTLTVEDTTKPSLTLVNQTVEVGQPWSYAITDNNISDVRDGETATIAVTSSLPTGVSYSSATRTFSASSLGTPGEHTISGTIADNSSNTNTWEFTLTVEADETAPSLTLVNQTVEAGESWSYEIVDNNITGLRDGETATIVVTSSLPTGVSYSSRTFSASSLNTVGEYTISGTISDGSNSDTWSFTLTVEDTTKPILTIANQTVEQRTAEWSYEIQDSNITGLRSGETVTILFTSSIPSGVSYNSSSKTFSASTSVLNTPDDYTISGTIADGSGNMNSWEFTLTVEADDTAPSLTLANQTVEAGESWSFEITDEAISDLRDVEAATIAITSTLPTGVSYDSATRTFSASSLDTVDEYTISGTISDGSNSNTWEFTLTVEDTTKPSLTLVNQTVEVGQPWSYAITDNNISDVRDGETATIAVTSSLPTGVSYSSATRTFSASSLGTPGEHTISGTIADNSSNTNTWSFKLTVVADETAPSLTLVDQTVEAGESWSYEIVDNNITGLRDGETATIVVTSSLPTGVSYSSRTFSASSLDTTGEYTISGTISDGSNSDTWSFTLTVEDTTKPILTLANQTVEVGQPWSYAITDNNITELRDGETATIAVTSSLPTGVSYSSATRTFSASSLGTPGEHTISGTIADNSSNTNTWSFKLTVVADETAPSLTLADQTVEAGESWSYEITDEAISDLRDAETATIAITSTLPTGVSYDSATRTFSASSLDTTGEYTISGTISDGSNSDTWSFTLTVEDTTKPILTIADQTVEQRTAEWSYVIQDEDISDVRDGETVTILFTSSVPTGVSYNSTTRTFSASTSVLNTPGDSTISGTISDGSNSNTWEFTLTVEADDTAPSLALVDQTVEAGESWSFEITDEAISDLRDAETATIAITSTLPTGVSYDSATRTFSASSLDTTGEYTISGTISDGSNSDTWSFTLTVEDTTKPILTIADQTVEQRTAEWSYVIQDEDISDVRDGETVTILFTSSVPSGVSYNSTTRTFSASTSVLNTPDDYTISGTISDGSNSNTWEFTLTVEADDTAPSLILANQTVEAGESWSYEITDEAISDLRDVETATIAVTSTLPTGVSYDSATKTFSASSLDTTGEYTISGTISDGSNSDTWEFTLTVEDTTKPILTIANQTVEQRTAEWSYVIQDEDISDVRDGETVTILFTSSVPTGVSYNSTTRTFSASTSVLNTPGDSTISGTISDGSNSNTWEFTLTVEADDTAPSLTLVDQTVEAGESWSYEITDEAISDLRDVETATIAVTSTLPTGVSYGSATRTFSASSLDTVGEYTISGTISDGSNSSTWSFTLTVEDTTKPILTIADQTVEQRTAEWSYEIIDNNITGLRSGETVTILFTSSVPTGVSYNSSSRTFSASTSVLNTPGDYTISGTISDGSNSNTWEFTLTVEADDTAPSLTLVDQTVEAGESWSYEITDEAISDLRDVETATIAITSTLPTGVSYDSATKTFSASSLDTTGEYTISGTISDGSNSSTWSFTLTVEDTTKPILTIADQTVEQRTAEWSYEIIDNNITGLRSGETVTILFTSSVPTGVSYNSSSRTFSASTSVLNTPGDYTISGTISDGSGNVNNWSFTLTVETDDTAPSLALENQTVEAGESWSYAITDSNISNLRTVETATILLTSSIPTGVSYNSTTRTFSASTSALNTPGTYRVSGMISDADGNTNPWEFTLTVEDTTKPVLSIANQTVEEGATEWSYTITDSNISSRAGETVIISVASQLPTGVSYNSLSKTLSTSDLDTPGVYTISGTIEDNSGNSSNWSFTLTVLNRSAPNLVVMNQTGEAGESWFYQIKDSDIMNLGDGEVATITVPSSQPTGVSYNSTTRTFSTLNLESTGTYTISGTISSDGNTSNPWEFTLTVEDTTPPTLAARDQSIEEGGSLSYAIESDIEDLRASETFTITVVTPSDAGVRYDATTKTFVTSSIDTEGTYTISGTMADNSGNVSNWSFTLTVLDTDGPILTTRDQTIESGMALSYYVGDDITNTQGETVLIGVLNSQGANVQYDAETQTFVTSRNLTPNAYSVHGLIVSPRGSNAWSFILNVEEKTVPRLAVTDQSVELGTGLSYYVGNKISGLKAGDTAEIVVTTSNGAQVSYNPVTQTFSTPTDLTEGTYTVEGTITIPRNSVSTNWSFDLIVEDTTPPTLVIGNHQGEVGERWEYLIQDNDIRGLREGETATIQITQQSNVNVTYSLGRHSFWSTSFLNPPGASGAPLIIGVHTIEGTISDDRGNTSRWSFTLTVVNKDGPLLVTRDQRVEVGEALSYRIDDGDISGLDPGEVAGVHIINGGSVNVRYDALSRTFSTLSLTDNDIGTYNISGVIGDGNGNSNGWVFTLIVEDTRTPILSIDTQRIQLGAEPSWSYQIQSGDISNLRASETVTIAVTSSLPTGVVYNSTTKTFSSTSDLNTLGDYTISGTISDENGNTSDWSFNLIVEDTIAPSFVTTDHVVEAGDSSWSYQIQSGDIRHLRAGENVTIRVTERTIASVQYNSETKTFSLYRAFTTAGDFVVRGTISDDNGNLNDWSLRLSVEDTTPPTLTIPNQEAAVGERGWSYQIKDSDITRRFNEPVTIITTTSSSQGVSYDSVTRTFSTTNLNTSKIYVVSGTIEDQHNNSSNWSFILSVVNSNAPTLATRNQTIEVGTALSYKVEDDDISGLSEGETARIVVLQANLPMGVSDITYNSETQIFSTPNINTAGTYLIGGTISGDSGALNLWSFTLTVEDTSVPSVPTVPSLATADQRIKVGEALSYRIDNSDISGLDEGETATITVTRGSGADVRYNSQTQTFSTLNIDIIGTYTVEGTISDGNGNIGSWSFRLTVEDSPRLSIDDQRVMERTIAWSYTVEDDDISGLAEGQRVTITVTNASAVTVSYNSATQTFSASNLNTIGTYTVEGTIADGRNNSSSWSFDLIVEADTTGPSLSIDDQTVEAGTALSYRVQESDISSLRAGESASIFVVGASDAKVRYRAATQTFYSESNLNTTETYTINGIIRDNRNNSTPWSFDVIVEDSTEPRLSINNQTTEERTVNWSYTIQESDILESRTGESLTVKVTQSNGAGVTYNPTTQTFSASNLNTIGTYTVEGTIEDEHDNSSDWSFDLIVEADTTGPSLALEDQTIEAGTALSYLILDEINDLREGESLVITVTEASDARVSYNPATLIFSTPTVNEIGTYTIAGTISDGSNTNNWSFDLIVEDKTNPILSIRAQRVEPGVSEWSYTVQESDISGSRTGESLTITVNEASDASVSYDPETQTFAASGLNPTGTDTYTISGTIEDENNNSSEWSFTLTLGADATAPSLAIDNQTGEAGERWSYQIQDDDISGLDEGETATIRVTASSHAAVIYHSGSKTLGTLGVLALDSGDDEVVHIIEGTIEDDTGNVSEWSFTLTVKDTTAPSLTIGNQTVESGDPWSYTVQESDISDLRTGETVTIKVITTDVSYNSATQTFSIATLVFNTIGTYTISGTIEDERGHRSNWSFALEVTNRSGPSLALEDQTIEAGTALSYYIGDKIGGLREGETEGIYIMTNGGADISYNSATQTFVTTTDLTAARYTIEGFIFRLGVPGSAQTNWSFDLIVEDTTAPYLTISNQTGILGTQWSYTIGENDLSGLRTGETATITVTDSSSLNVSYNATTKTFSADLNRIEIQDLINLLGDYTISGTISDDTGNVRNWSLTLTVEENSNAPRLSINDQTIVVGRALSYQLQEGDIQGSRLVESRIFITQTNVGVGYDSVSKTFWTSAVNTEGTHVVRGVVVGSTGLVSTWSFNLIVVPTSEAPAPPSLNIPSQIMVSVGSFWRYTIVNRDITGLLNRESEIIRITDQDGTGITYNAATRTFQTAPLFRARVYTIKGTIGSSGFATNASVWSVTLRVRDSTAPSLVTRNQTVVVGSALSYELPQDAIQGIVPGERITITVNTPSDARVEYDPVTKTFSTQALNEVGVHTVGGTISDQNSNGNPWSFLLTVLAEADRTAPTLTLVNQSLPTRGGLSYRVPESAIRGVRRGETVTITIENTGGLDVTYNPDKRLFQSPNQDNPFGRVYLIRGTISDDSGNENRWSFFVTIR